MTPPETVSTEPLPLAEQTLPSIWQEVLAQVGRIQASHWEKAGLPAISGPNTLVIRFGPGYNAESDFCQVAERVERLNQAIHKVTGQSFQLRIETVASGAVPRRRSRPRIAQFQSTVRLKNGLKRYKSRSSGRAIDVLGAEPVPGRVDEGFGAAPPEVPERPPDVEET